MMLTRVFWLTLSAIAFTVTLVLTILPKTTSAQFDLLIQNTRPLIGDELTSGLDIGIVNGHIVKLAPNIQGSATQVIDAAGKSVIPGLIDAHTHTYGDAQKQAVRFGVSAHVDMFTNSTWLMKSRVDRDDVANPQQTDLFSSGMLATVATGHGTQFGTPVETINNETNLVQWVTRRQQEGSDFIKLVYMPYQRFFASLDKETASQLIKTSHAAGLKVVAHIASQQGAQDMLDAGIDGLVHQFADSRVSDAFLQQAVSQGLFVIPTLSVIASADQQQFAHHLKKHPHVSERLTSSQRQQLDTTFGDTKLPRLDYSIAVSNTKAMFAAGIPILAGSDAPNPGTTFGASLHQELQLLVNAGLSPLAAIQAATINVVKAFELTSMTDRAAIKEGHRADLIILNHSPLESIEHTLDIHKVIKNGQNVQRDLSTLTPQSVVLSNAALSQFQIDLGNQNGMQWSATDDRMRGGQSTAIIKRQDGVLTVKTDTSRHIRFPWAGAGVFAKQVLDIGDYNTLSFRVRGTSGQYAVLAFSGDETSIPTMQTFKIKEQWNQIELPLSQFPGIDLNTIRGFAFVAGLAEGEFEYSLDDVKLK